MARCFPCEHPLQTKHLLFDSSSVFYRQFRPEFLTLLRDRGFPSLSPDALTNWGRQGAKELNGRSVIATRLLLREISILVSTLE